MKHKIKKGVLLAAMLAMFPAAALTVRACSTDPDTGGCTTSSEGDTSGCPSGQACHTHSDGCYCS